MLNRRRFLAASASVLAAMAAGCARVLPGAKQVAVPSAPPPAPAPAAPAAEAAQAAVRPIRVALLSDVHLQAEESGLAKTVNVKMAKAVQELAAAQPDLWITNGDIADHGISAELEAFKKIMAKVAPADRILTTTGNHEFYDMETTDDISLHRWREAFGVEKPYTSRVYEGIHFVMLADEQWKLAPYNKDWCWITPEQMRWFEQVLYEHKDKLTIAFMHQPLNETVAGSLGEKAFGGTNMAKEIYALLGKNPQVKLWFSGHTHRKLEVEGQVVEKNGVTFMGLGSTIYGIGPKPGGGNGRDADSNQTRLLEIYPDRVRVLARDHTAGRWMDELEQIIKRT